jgi:serine/arginine repetitive matrix protein 1
MRKVNLQVIRPWVTKKVVELLGLDDELVVEYAMGLLEDESQTVKPAILSVDPLAHLHEQTPDPKKMQINLTGFLTDSTPVFMAALWNLLIEAQTSPAGIPQSFVEEKKEEMRRAKEGDTRALTERDRRQRLDEIRDRERSERSDRGGGRGRGRGRRGRGGIGNDDRPRDNGWSSRGGGVSNPSLRFQYKEKNILRSLASTISLSPPFSRISSPWQDALQRSLISFRRPSVSLALAQPHPCTFA